MKKTKLIFAFVPFVLSGCTITFSHNTSIDYGHKHYYQITDTNICFGEHGFSDIQVRDQVSCSSLPQEKQKTISPEKDNSEILISGISQDNDKRIGNIYYYPEYKICRIVHENEMRETSCFSQMYLN